MYERLQRENRSHLVNSVSGQGEGGAEVHSMTMDCKVWCSFIQPDFHWALLAVCQTLSQRVRRHIRK